jgi:hypothetical protein
VLPSSPEVISILVASQYPVKTSDTVLVGSSRAAPSSANTVPTLFTKKERKFSHFLTIAVSALAYALAPSSAELDTFSAFVEQASATNFAYSCSLSPMASNAAA